MANTNWLKVIAGAYFISPFSPEDAFTGGALVIPSAILGSYLVADGLGVFK